MWWAYSAPLLKSVGAVVLLPGPLAPLISTPLFEWCSTLPTAGGDLYKQCENDILAQKLACSQMFPRVQSQYVSLKLTHGEDLFSYEVLLIRLHTIFLVICLLFDKPNCFWRCREEVRFFKQLVVQLCLASQKRRQVSNPDYDPCSMYQETHTIYIPTLPSAYLDAYLFAVQSITMGTKLL